MCFGTWKELTAAVYANSPINTVVESDCGLVVISDPKGHARTRCVIEHTHVNKSTEFGGRGTNISALDAVESSGALVQLTTPQYEKVACEYANSRIVDATTGCKITRTDVL
ncbi:hypothetical protein Plhal710r2_c025g0101731 [Plasmopara halstedii]